MSRIFFWFGLNLYRRCGGEADFGVVVVVVALPLGEGHRAEMLVVAASTAVVIAALGLMVADEERCLFCAGCLSVDSCSLKKLFGMSVSVSGATSLLCTRLQSVAPRSS